MSRRYYIEHPDESEDRWIVVTKWDCLESGGVTEESMTEILVGENELLDFVAQQLLMVESYEKLEITKNHSGRIPL
jgi:hypothetical protein